MATDPTSLAKEPEALDESFAELDKERQNDQRVDRLASIGAATFGHLRTRKRPLTVCSGSATKKLLTSEKVTEETKAAASGDFGREDDDQHDEDQEAPLPAEAAWARRQIELMQERWERLGTLESEEEEEEEVWPGQHETTADQRTDMTPSKRGRPRKNNGSVNKNYVVPGTPKVAANETGLMRLEEYVIGSVQANGAALKDDRLFGCSFCAFTGVKSDWSAHLRAAHAAQRGLVFCRRGGPRNPCGAPFSCTSALERHAQEVHGPKKVNASNKPSSEATPTREGSSGGPANAGGGDDGHICPLCGMMFGSAKSYRRHQELEHEQLETGRFNDAVDYFDPSPTLPLHDERKPTIDKFKCDREGCDRTFYSQLKLDDHKRSQHTKERPFICSFCGDSFYSKATMAQHEKKQHLESSCPRSRAVCRVCGKTFHVNYLGTHMKTHAGAEDYSCTVCNKDFSSRQARVRHEAIHFGDKKHACQFCGKAFVQKVNMEAHERIHTGARPYICNFCGEGFAQGTRRNQHQKTCVARTGDMLDVVKAQHVEKSEPFSPENESFGPPVLNVPYVPPPMAAPGQVSTPPLPFPPPPHRETFIFQPENLPPPQPTPPPPPIQVQFQPQLFLSTPQQAGFTLTLQAPLPHQHLQSPPPAIMSPAASDAGSTYAGSLTGEASPAPPPPSQSTTYFWTPGGGYD